jgi:hypothetical protein
VLALGIFIKNAATAAPVAFYYGALFFIAHSTSLRRRRRFLYLKMIQETFSGREYTINAKRGSRCDLIISS